MRERTRWRPEAQTEVQGLRLAEREWDRLISDVGGLSFPTTRQRAPAITNHARNRTHPTPSMAAITGCVDSPVPRSLTNRRAFACGAQKLRSPP
jgi:hypothetical protein